MLASGELLMADSDRPQPRKRAPRDMAVPRTPDAVDIALDRLDDDDTARALLAKHTQLLEAQIRTEKLDHGAKRMAMAARFLIAFVALSIAGGLLWMVLAARADRGLVVEAFATPPDLAARGLTGEVLAGNLADRLGEIDRAANSFRSPETMSVNWGDDVRIEIPSTGVSIDELDRYLRRRLGHQTVVGGSVFRSAQGLRMTVRTGALGTVEQTGDDTKLEDMIRRAAEGVFEKTQPYRYSKYLEFSGRTDEAMAVARRDAQTSDDPKERAWAWAQISNLLDAAGDVQAAVDAGKRALVDDPGNALAYLNTAIALEQLSHGRESAFYGRMAGQLGSNSSGGLSEIGINTSRANLASVPARTGDFQQALRQIDRITGPVYGGTREFDAGTRADLLLALHDVSGSRKMPLPPDTYFVAHFASLGSLTAPQHKRALVMEDWPAALKASDAMLAALNAAPEGQAVAEVERQRFILPLRAVDLALNGRIGEARALVAPLPLDCANCNFARMDVAALAGDVPAAYRWLAEVHRWAAPAPFAETEFARVLLGRGDYAGALRLADQALIAGPKFADALKFRGDALRKLNRLDEAVSSYADAAQAAPRWGRLQIDWGFAEMRRGRWPEARKHLAAAATMDLNSADRRLLTRLDQVAKGR
jgi:tetratricopeptide (TPR) repeat protein